MNNEKNIYYILSGEGESGTWSRHETTERGLKTLITRMSCNGDRWVQAYDYISAGGGYRARLEGVNCTYIRDVPQDVAWNARRKVKVVYAGGWKAPKRVFRSLAECASYLKEQFGEATYIDVNPEEIDGAAVIEARTFLCGNDKLCANVCL